MKFIVNKQKIIFEPMPLVSGTVNGGDIPDYTAEFEFDAEWDGYTKTAVFQAQGSNPVYLVLTEDRCTIPVECLDKSVRVGVAGVKGENAYPTIFTQYIPVALGCFTDGIYDPTPPMYEQILSLLSEVNSAMASINEDLATIHEDIAEINLDISELDLDTDGIHEALDGIGEDIRSLAGGLNALSGTVDGIDLRVTNVQAQADATDGAIGSLSELDTEDKSSIVKSINSLKENTVEIGD